MAFLVTAIPLAAQSRPIELGIDGGLSYKTNSPTTLQLGLPVQNFRVGFAAGPTVSIEPNVVVNYIKVEGLDGVFHFGPELGVLIHFSTETNRSRGYFRPFMGATFVSGGGTSVNQFDLGGGVGVKVPITGSRLAARFEGGVRHGFKGDLPSATSIYALFGFSFFTK